MTATEAQNKAFVLKAVDTLFNKRDYAAAERFWSPAYIQHSALVAPGREGLFEFVKAAPKELHYENALIVADGDYVMLHGRFSGIGQPVNWVVVDILRIDNGLLAEHWDVIQDEATRESSKSGQPMFGDKFPHLTTTLQRASDRSVAETSGSSNN
jgi:predicted SnoaL-like aldol condensation-catalyzing enzyme